MDSVEIQIILVINYTGLEHNCCSMLMNHGIYAEIVSCNYDALQLILQTGLGWMGVLSWGVLGSVVVLPSSPFLPVPH